MNFIDLLPLLIAGVVVLLFYRVLVRWWFSRYRLRFVTITVCYSVILWLFVEAVDCCYVWFGPLFGDTFDFLPRYWFAVRFVDLLIFLPLHSHAICCPFAFVTLYSSRNVRCLFTFSDTCYLFVWFIHYGDLGMENFTVLRSIHDLRDDRWVVDFDYSFDVLLFLFCYRSPVRCC